MAAFTIPSETHPTQASLKSLFEFISDFKNFASIMPEDKVEDFTHTNESCSFTIKGITPMTIKIAEKIPYQMIYFSSEGLSKFNFNLKVNFTGLPDEKGQCQIDLSGDLNPFILKMAEKSLANLVNTMSLRLSQLEINTHAN